jgi:nitrogen regulatory protein PII
METISLELAAMKLIVALIRHYHLEFVQPALDRHGWHLTSVSQVLGGAGQDTYTLVYREREIRVGRPKLRLEVMVDEWDVAAAIDVIREATAAGCPNHISDAKIMVLTVEESSAPNGHRLHAPSTATASAARSAAAGCS